MSIFNNFWCFEKLSVCAFQKSQKHNKTHAVKQRTRTIPVKFSIFSMKMPTWTWCGHTNNCSKINKIPKIYYLSSIIHFCFLMKLLGVQYGEHSIKSKNLPPISKYLQILGGIKALTPHHYPKLLPLFQNITLSVITFLNV